MTNTIHNVPRELPTPYELATHEGRKRDESRSSGYCGSCSIETHIAQLKDPKSWVHSSIKVWEKLGGLHSESAPSPAGVDGWDVAGDILEKLSAAQAIIDGLREEVERSQRFAAGHVLTNERISANLHAVESERDQQAQRIGELEQILRDLVPGCKWRIMRPRIDAALAEIDHGNE